MRITNKKFSKTLLFKSGYIDLINQTVVLTRINNLIYKIPFHWFEPNAVCSPNFNDFEIIDYGTAIRFGEYEVCSNTILKHFDEQCKEYFKSILIRT